MSRAKVTSKGQLTVPADVRRALGIAEGTVVDFIPEDDGTYRITVASRSVRDLKGALHTSGRILTVAEMDAVIGTGGSPDPSEHQASS